MTDHDTIGVPPFISIATKPNGHIPGTMKYYDDYGVVSNPTVVLDSLFPGNTQSFK
jgi:hypothetical protein